MKKKLPVRRKKHVSSPRILPIDSRIIPSIFSFGHVKGIARVFLEIEIILAVVSVLGTVIIAVMKMVAV